MNNSLIDRLINDNIKVVTNARREIMEPKKKSSLIDQEGSKVHLYSVMKGNVFYSATLVTPSNYKVKKDGQIISKSDSTVITKKHHVSSEELSKMCLDEARFYLFDRLLPPKPIISRDYKEEQPRILLDIFEFESFKILSKIVEGLK